MILIKSSYVYDYEGGDIVCFECREATFENEGY